MIVYFMLYTIEKQYNSKRREWVKQVDLITTFSLRCRATPSICINNKTCSYLRRESWRDGWGWITRMIDPSPSVKPLSTTMIFGKYTNVCGVNRWINFPFIWTSTVEGLPKDLLRAKKVCAAITFVLNGAIRITSPYRPGSAWRKLSLR